MSYHCGVVFVFACLSAALLCILPVAISSESFEACGDILEFFFFSFPERRRGLSPLPQGGWRWEAGIPFFPRKETCGGGSRVTSLAWSITIYAALDSKARLPSRSDGALILFRCLSTRLPFPSRPLSHLLATSLCLTVFFPPLFSLL